MVSSEKIIYVIGTMDTKGPEVLFVAEQLRSSPWLQTQGISVETFDVSTSIQTNLAQEDLASLDRSAAIQKMSSKLVEFLTKSHMNGKLVGAIGLGGSGGTALIAPALRALPIGIPKMMVSTVASGNVGPYIGCSDLVMLPSIVDVSGLNAVSTKILGNAANALAGMVCGKVGKDPVKPALAMTMFGVTTPCVTGVRQGLEKLGYDCLVFHATGVGGQAMEGLIESGFVQGVLDLTTTEVADEVVGGVFAAGPKRFDYLSQHKIPCVLSVGAMDMVNFGALETVPEKFRHRRLHVHNSNVTLMRTTPDENRLCAQWIANKLSKSIAPVRVLLPLHGVSALDSAGKPFYDPQADEALFDELQKHLHGLANVRLETIAAHINDLSFIERVLSAFQEIFKP
ncbi:MAG: Tm-1-like ATP-binding domain-containing protein [Planctomycetota bacterium]